MALPAEALTLDQPLTAESGLKVPPAGVAKNSRGSVIGVSRW